MTIEPIRYVNVEQAFEHIDGDGLLVGNNAEWAKEAICKADYIDLNYYIPISEIDKIIEECEAKRQQALGWSDVAYHLAMARAEAFEDVIKLLKALDPEVER